MKIKIAGSNISFPVLFSETEEFFCTWEAAQRDDGSEGMDRVFRITEDEMRSWEKRNGKSIANMFEQEEALRIPVSNALLSMNACLFHSVAIRFHGKALLFSAPSGTGKTTQYRLWKQLYGDELRMICGDLPVLSRREADNLYVYPSPWNGKEAFAGRKGAPLGGIIVLKQGSCNTIRRLSVREALKPLYEQLVFSRDTVQRLQHAFYILDGVLSRFPVWELTNLGDLASARLGHDTVLSEWEKEDPDYVCE